MSARLIRNPTPMSPELEALLERSRERVARMSDLERRRMEWDQRVSWVYGNVSLSNPDVTREMVVERMIAEYGPRP